MYVRVGLHCTGMHTEAISAGFALFKTEALSVCGSRFFTNNIFEMDVTDMLAVLYVK